MLYFFVFYIFFYGTKVLRASDGVLIKKITQGVSGIAKIAKFVDDFRQLVIGRKNGDAQIWDLENGFVIQDLPDTLIQQYIL